MKKNVLDHHRLDHRHWVDWYSKQNIRFMSIQIQGHHLGI